MAEDSFRHLKVGDTVTRMFGGKIPMRMQVVEVLPDLLRCDTVQPIITDGKYWEFCRDTGAEIDDTLGWGPAYGVTGSTLVQDTSASAWSKTK